MEAIDKIEETKKPKLDLERKPIVMREGFGTEELQEELLHLNMIRDFTSLFYVVGDGPDVHVFRVGEVGDSKKVTVLNMTEDEYMDYTPDEFFALHVGGKGFHSIIFHPEDEYGDAIEDRDGLFIMTVKRKPLKELIGEFHYRIVNQGADWMHPEDHKVLCELVGQLERYDL